MINRSAGIRSLSLAIRCGPATRVSAKVRPLSLAESAGIVFRYHTNRHYYVFSISGGKKARLALRLPLEHEFRVIDWKELGSAECLVRRQAILRTEGRERRAKDPRLL